MNKLPLLIPAFLLLAATEWWFSRRKNPDYVTGQNTALNMAIGAIDQLVSIANFALFVWILKITYDNLRLFTLGNSWYVWVLAYAAVDFVSYWYHRFSHRIAFLWCGHVTHHSSDHFNLTNGFRTSPFQGLNRIPFWIILPVLGFSPQMLFAIFVISGLYDFFLHTENFPKMRWLETVFITPSLHRVHHGKNDIYIDKNYGSTFSFWDRMFGTYQEETEKVEYGILSKDYVDGDPVDAIFHHYEYLWKLMRSTKSWKNRLKVLFMPPDYKPEDSELHLEPLAYADPHNKRQFNYGLGLFAFSSLGILATLVIEPLLSFWTFLYFAFFAAGGMVVAVRIFHYRTGDHFRRNEMFRHLLLAMLGAMLIYFEPAYYGALLIGCSFSMILAAVFWVLSDPVEQLTEFHRQAILRQKDQLEKK